MLVGVAAAATPRFVNSREITLGYRTSDAAPIDQVRVWVSEDRGRSWVECDELTQVAGAVRFTVARDGRYDVYMVLSNPAGQSAEPPVGGSRPHSAILVDTLSPLIQVHDATLTPLREIGFQATLRVSLIEENLHDDGVRLFYRAVGTDAWRDGGAVAVVDDAIDWPVPAAAPLPLELVLLTSDLAGNRAKSEPIVLSETVVAAEAPPEPTSRAPGAAPEPVAAAAVRSRPIPPQESRGVDRLRERAAEFAAQGRYALAAQRYRDALDIAPREPDLLASLGTMLYHLRDFEAAAGSYEHALAAQPEFPAALEGLALVAQTDRRYADAEQYLKRLSAQQPDAPLTWLRLGDVAHRLGNERHARDAWQQVLELDAPSELRDRARQRLTRFIHNQLAAANPHGEDDPATSDHRDLRRRAVSEAGGTRSRTQ
jgi:TolA-binding protein